MTMRLATAMSLGEALARGAAALPRAEARLLLIHACGIGHARLAAHPEAALEDDARARYEEWIARRASGEPVAYILGWREFYGRRFRVGEAVLIPRPETELLVDLALEAARPLGACPRIADLGTGSGAIAVSLALELPCAEVWACEVSESALAIARANAAALGARVCFRQGDWFSAFERGSRFDLLVCNPPYVAEGDAHLGRGDLRREPRAALAGGPDGLAMIRRVVREAPAFLAPGGRLMIEHGWDQASRVRALLAAAGFGALRSHRDLAGIERVSTGRLGV
ncbi:MAG: peptide chain release factor N(5)-glutamine methyltransferase [Rhodocyclaceae bacterium]